jgi:hypothetical protein
VFASPDSAFVVEFPGPVQSRTRDTEQGTLRTTAVAWKGGGLSVAALDMREGHPPIDHAASLQAVAEHSQGKLVRQADFTLQGHTGKRFEMEISQPITGFLTGRAFVVKNRLYQVLAFGPQERASDTDVPHFLDSFKLTEGAAPAGPGEAQGK